MTVRSSGGGVRDVVLGAGGGCLGVRDIVENGWGGCICVYWNRLMEGEVSNGRHSRDRTHVKNLKNILEAQRPGSDRLFIFLRAETPIDHAPFIPLRELPPNICHGPAIGKHYDERSRCVSLVQLTPTTDPSHRAQTD